VKFYEDDDEYRRYLIQWVADGLEEGEEFFRELLNALDVGPEDVQEAPLEVWQEFAKDDPEALLEMLNAGQR